MAIAMAQAGGIGVIHRNLEPDAAGRAGPPGQEIRIRHGGEPAHHRARRDAAEALDLMKENHISGIPVVEGGGNGKAGKLVGILTNRDVRFATDPRQRVAELMTKDKLITVREGVSQDEAKRLLHQHRIEKLLVVDEPISLRRPDHRQGHRKGGDQSERLQGRAGPPARRRRHHGRRQGLRAHRGADRGRRRSRRGRHRARPFALRARRGHPHQEACRTRCRWWPAMSPPPKAPRR